MILDFNDELGKRHFEFCFVGFVLGGCIQQTKGMIILRRELRLLEKLESISDIKPCGKKMANGEPERQLKNGNADLQIQIDPPEYDLLHTYIAQVPWQSGSPVRYALECIDWLAERNKNEL